MVDNGVNRWLRCWVDGLFPARCILCAAATHRRLDLCHACECDLPRLQNPCPHCALPRIGDSAVQLCGHCWRQPMKFQYCVSLLSYQAPASRLVAAFKYRRKMLCGRVLGELLAQEIRTRYQQREQALPEAILPVPLHWRRLQKRGFNQAGALSSLLAQQLGVPQLRGACRRVRATPAQAQLTAAARQRNLRAAFRLRAGYPLPKRVALVDDVLTTGATANELSRVLRAGGATEVHVWCLARALTPADQGVL